MGPNQDFTWKSQNFVKAFSAWESKKPRHRLLKYYSVTNPCGFYLKIPPATQVELEIILTRTHYLFLGFHMSGVINNNTCNIFVNELKS